jgi:hypothetical protein
MHKVIASIIASAIIATPATALACSLSPFPPPPMCERFWNGDAVALIEVTDIHESNTNHRRVTLRVLDIFRGDPPLELTIKDPWTSCGVTFGQKGQYLAWLFHENDSWTAFGDRAGRWGDKDLTSEDLRYAQSMKHPPSTGRIFGTLDKPPQMLFGQKNSNEPLPIRAGAVVVATGSSGTFQAAISPALNFELPGLAPGKYSVTVFGLRPELSVLPEEVEVHAGGCKQLYLSSGSSSEVKGRVYGRGRVPQTAWIHLIPTTQPPVAHSREMKVFADSETGVFEFKHVDPGSYVLGFELGHSPTLDNPYAARYYPEAKDAASAKIIEVKAGQQIENLEFDLGTEVPRRLVHVRVTWSDGSPVHKATAYLRDAHNPYSSVAEEQTETDENGEVILEGFIDTDYDVDANAVCKGTAATRDIKKKVIPATPSNTSVQLHVIGKKCVLVGNGYIDELKRLEDLEP